MVTKCSSKNKSSQSGQVHRAVAMEPLETRTLLSTSLTGLDLSYGDHGVVRITNNHPATVVTKGAVSLPDGQVILAGYAPTTRETAGALVLTRINKDGTLDRKFGEGGFSVTTTADRISFFVSAIVLHGDKVLVGGTLRSDDSAGGYHGEIVELLQFTRDGTLDRSFGRKGQVVVDLGGDRRLTSLAIQDDGKILAAGSAPSPRFSSMRDFSVMRFNEDGTIDSGFGTSGTVTNAFYRSGYGVDSEATAVAVADDGRIVLAGDGAGFDVLVLKRDGSPDASFGSNGQLQVLTNLRSTSVRSVAVRSDGEIFVAGASTSRHDPRGTAAMTVLSITPRGELARFFGSHGVVRQYIRGSNQQPTTALATDIELLPSGQIVVSGGVEGGDASGPLIARLNANGSADANFGDGGMTIYPSLRFGAPDPYHQAPFQHGTEPYFAQGLVAQLDGTFIVAFQGVTARSKEFDHLLSVHFESDGSIDRSYGGSGLSAMAPNVAGPIWNYGSTIGPSGNVYFHIVHDDSSFSHELIRFTPSGKRDLAYRGPSLYVQEGAMAVQPDEKLLIPSTSAGEERFNADGSLDLTYGTSGTYDGRWVSPGGYAGKAAEIRVLPDGNSIAWGQIFYLFTGPSVSRVFMFNASGHEIHAADAGASYSYPMRGDDMVAMDVAPDGKIITVGSSKEGPRGSRNSIVVRRFNADLSIDTSFGDNGKTVVRSPSGPVRAVSVAALADGRVLVSGSTYDRHSEALLTRLKADGTLDTSYGSNGFAMNLAVGGQLQRVPDGRIFIAAGGRAVHVAILERDGRPGSAYFSTSQGALKLGGAARLTKLGVAQIGGASYLVVLGATSGQSGLPRLNGGDTEFAIRLKI